MGEQVGPTVSTLKGEQIKTRLATDMESCQKDSRVVRSFQEDAEHSASCQPDRVENETFLPRRALAPPSLSLGQMGLLSHPREEWRWDIRQQFWSLPNLNLTMPSLDLKRIMQTVLTDIDWRQVLLILALMLLINLFWDSQIVYPLKILVVFFHEASHGIAAYLTGGSVDHLEVSKFEGGVTYTKGGNRFIILTAGYLGSLVWGGTVLILASRTRYDRYVSIALGISMLAIGLSFVRPLFSFGQLFTVITGIILCGIGYALPEQVNDVALRLIGLTSCMYAVLDIKSDVLDRPYLQSDAALLAEETRTPTLLWGVLWITIAVLWSVGFLIFASKSFGDDAAQSWWPATGTSYAVEP